MENFKTIMYEEADAVARITLIRPDVFTSKGE